MPKTKIFKMENSTWNLPKTYSVVTHSPIRMLIYQNKESVAKRGLIWNL